MSSIGYKVNWRATISHIVKGKQYDSSVVFIIARCCLIYLKNLERTSEGFIEDERFKELTGSLCLLATIVSDQKAY